LEFIVKRGRLMEKIHGGFRAKEEGTIVHLALVYDTFGGPDVFSLRDIPDIRPGTHEVTVKVLAAGINLFDLVRSEGNIRATDVTFPAVVGTDFAGVIDQVGNGVTVFSVGDQVLGRAPQGAVAEMVTTDISYVVRRPAGIPVSLAAGIPMVGRTAWAAVEALRPGKTDTVLVSAAAGGVGVMTAQLVRERGARVIGTASLANHGFLRAIGVEPIEYGQDLAARLHHMALQGITMVFDTYGEDTVNAALDLGVPSDRINTVIAHERAHNVGARTVGSSAAPPAALGCIVSRVADGRIVLPPPRVWPLARYKDAFHSLARRHGRGRRVIAISHE
jgi:NADPH:quinone reductase-like Zn-dependent oxidoreductase